MGQAKRRGSYEQRKQDAIQSNIEIAKLLKQQEQQWFDSLSCVEAASVRLGRAKAAAAFATAGNVSAVRHISNSVPFQNL